MGALYKEMNRNINMNINMSINMNITSISPVAPIRHTCTTLFNCCDCGDRDRDMQCCGYCFTCNACDHCYNAAINATGFEDDAVLYSGCEFAE